MLDPVPGTDPNTVDMILALESSYSSERDTCFKQCQHTCEFWVLWFLSFSCNFIGKRWVLQEHSRLSMFKGLHPAGVESQLSLCPKKFVCKVAMSGIRDSSGKLPVASSRAVIMGTVRVSAFLWASLWLREAIASGLALDLLLPQFPQ